VNPANPFGDLGKLLLLGGLALAGVGLLLLVGGRLPFRLGRLPGDISYQGRSGSFYFPVVTCIVLSVAFTLIMWIVNHFRR
jgi:ABC-type tungstate transport system substrate-binding protein